MTLTATTSKISYSGDGSTTAFSVTFVFWDSDDLRVVLRDANDNETVWVRGTDYTVSGGSGSTGTVMATTAPASGETLVIISNVSLIQDTNFPIGGAFPSAAAEQEIDQIVRMNQQADNRIDRAMLAPESELTSIGKLPIASSRANKYLLFDASGDPGLSGDPPPLPNVYSVRAYNAVADGDGAGGGTDDAAAFQSALDAANDAGGGTVWVPAGTYRIDKQLTGYSNITFVVDAAATLDYTSADDGGASTGRPGDFWILGAGTMGDAVAVSGSLSAGDTTINTGSAHGLSKGDLFIVQSDQNSLLNDWETGTDYAVGDVVKESSTWYVCDEAHTSGTFATDLAANKWSATTGGAHPDILGFGTAGVSTSLYTEMLEADTVPSSTQITIRNGLRYAYASGANPKIYKITPVENFHIRGPGTIQGSGDVKGIEIRKGRKCSIRGLNVIADGGIPAIALRMCIRCDVLENEHDTPDLSASAIAIQISHASTLCRVIGNSGQSGSHLIDVTIDDIPDEDSDTGRITGPCRSISVHFNRARNVPGYPFSSHDGSDGVSFIGNIAENCTRGLVSRSRNALIVGNHLASEDATSAFGIFVGQQSINSLTFGNHVEGFVTQIDVRAGDDTAFHPAVNHVVRDNFLTGGQTIGIAVEGAGSGKATDVGLTITGNHIQKFSGSRAIHIKDNCDGAMVTGNRIKGAVTTAGIRVEDDNDNIFIDQNVFSDIGAGKPPISAVGTVRLGNNFVFGDAGDNDINSVAETHMNVDGILAEDGTAALPAFSFLDDRDAGMFRINQTALGFTVQGSRSFMVTGGSATVNFLQVNAKGTGTAPSLSASGTDTDVDVELTPQGAGVVKAGGNTVLDVSGFTLDDAADIAVGTTTGTKIGTATSQKLGFFNATPVVQQTASVALTDSSGGSTDGTVAAVSGSGADSDINNNFAELVKEVNQLRTALVNLGLAG